jgi:hypothetical protein
MIGNEEAIRLEYELRHEFGETFWRQEQHQIENELDKRHLHEMIDRSVTEIAPNVFICRVDVYISPFEYARIIYTVLYVNDKLHFCRCDDAKT